VNQPQVENVCSGAHNSAKIPSMADQQFSLLSGEEIKSLGLVEDSVDENLYRASTYDLSVGEIIASEEDEARLESNGSKFALLPGGMIRVVSIESLRMPETITAHVLLKNELCTRGILAINIGVCDPGYEGPISSTLINFGKKKFVVKKGTPFLRVSFHRCPQSPKAKDSHKYDRAGYLKNVRQEVDIYSGPKFLNMDDTAVKAAEKIFGRFKNGLILWGSLAAVLLALLAIFAPLGASNMDKYFAAREQHELQLEQTVEKKLEERYETRLKALSDQVEELKRTTAERSGHGNAPKGKP
jgi:deoxycytidine triphosphate deaminase